MELYHLRCLQAVVEEGGFKRATTRLHVTQPALSYQIKQLEQELGTSLFDRRPGGVNPTEAGRVLYMHARTIGEAVARAQRAVEELAEGVVGEIRIGTVNSIGIYFLPQVLWDMQQTYPSARPRVHYRDSDEIIDNLLQNRIDLAMVANPRPDRRLRQETILVERVSLVCGRSHPFYHRKSVRPSELKGIQFVALSKENPTGQLVVKHLHRLGVHVEPVVTTENVETVKKMAEVGLGVAFLPDMVTQQETGCDGKPGRLARVQVGPPLTRRIALITWKHFEAGRAVQAFIELLKSFATNWRPCIETSTELE
ncbi:MAG: LysR family transcriptional regulator [Pseudomonadota bacterium]